MVFIEFKGLWLSGLKQMAMYHGGADVANSSHDAGSNPARPAIIFY